LTPGLIVPIVVAIVMVITAIIGYVLDRTA
jgi:hypothetical protein